MYTLVYFSNERKGDGMGGGGEGVRMKAGKKTSVCFSIPHHDPSPLSSFEFTSFLLLFCNLHVFEYLFISYCYYSKIILVFSAALKMMSGLATLSVMLL